MSKLAPFVACAALILAGALHAKVSDACSPPLCTKAYLAPADGTTLPTTAPALFFQPARWNGPYDSDAGLVLPTLWSGGQEMLLTPAEQPDGTWLLSPVQAFQSGVQYELRYNEACTDPYPQDGGAPEVVQSFTATGQGPVSTSIGKLSVEYATTQPWTVVTSSGSCTTSLWASVVYIGLAFDASLKPYLATTTITTKVDGETWASSPYGVDDLPASSYSQAQAARKFNRIFGACYGEGTASDDKGVGLGPHTLEIRAHVAGATSDPPPQTLEIYVGCTSVDDIVPQDAAHDSGHGASGGWSTPAPEEGGCAASGVRNGFAGAWLVALCVMALARGRRRR
jgi:hypothetical protein